MTQQTARVLCAVLALTAVAAGCGGSSNTPAPSSSATDPTTTAGGQPPSTTRATVTATTTPTTAVSPAQIPADAALVLRLLPEPHDLPTGWTLVENEPLTGDDLNAPPDACDPT